MLFKKLTLALLGMIAVASAMSALPDSNPELGGSPASVGVQDYDYL